ncbi:hypothetical protein BVRB_4g080140 [Beta vulgaris subsp. vulgaris]|nr:hypothetical protein BVRB_4g080140 [Beta vulgaris subsp. vulgaris]
MAFEWWSASATARWLGHRISYLTPTTWSANFTPSSYRSWSWDPQNLLRWSGSFSIVDDLLWSVVTALESVVLVSMLGFFFLFCGCNF